MRIAQLILPVKLQNQISRVLTMVNKSQNERSTTRKGAPPKVIIDLSRLADQQVMVRLTGGRQVQGILKGWDSLLNLVLDQAVEQLRGKVLISISFFPPNFKK